MNPSASSSSPGARAPLHVGVLTGGGDCPGLNAVIRAVTMCLTQEVGARVSGIERGFWGLMHGRVRPLARGDVHHIVHEGGTILGTHNTANPFQWLEAGGADASAQAMEHVRALGLDALVVIGGDGTMSIAHRFEPLGLPMVGVPKTIDNDLMHTDRTFGFDSAVAVVADALERLETTARSHGRVMVLETMGRYAGWIALEGGLAGGADVIVLPELPYDADEIARVCQQRHAEQGYALVCIAEGAKPQGGQLTVRERLEHSPDPLRLGGVGEVLRAQLAERLTCCEVRSTQLGHLQRGGSPTPFDRVLATRFGHYAAELVKQRRFGRMVVLQGDACHSVPLAEVADVTRTVPPGHPLLLAAHHMGISLGVVDADASNANNA